MSDFQNRLGHDNFVWWIGVVEDRFDPLNLGRCRVRIFGSHTENLQLVPTSSLPWATPLYPVNDSRTFSTPMEGDYVFGFFMDGLSSQAPTMLGVFPAIPQSVDAPKGVGFSANAKLTNAPVGFGAIGQITREEFLANTTPVVSTGTPAMAIVRTGEPTTPALAHTIVGTSIERSNNNRAHVCDIANIIRYEIALQKLEAYGIFTVLRDAIEALTSAVSGSPIVAQITLAIKTLRGYVKMIQKGVDFVNEVVLEIASFVKYIQAMIAYIVSLPAQLAAMLQQCLLELQAALTGALNISFSGGLLGEVQGLIGDVAKLSSSAASTAVNATATTALLNPKSYGRA
jgi:hypothetical protein